MNLALTSRLCPAVLVTVLALSFSSPSFCSTPIYREMPEDESNALEVMRDWEEQIYLAMEKEDLPRYRVKRGIIQTPRDTAYGAAASGPPEIPEHSTGALYDLAVSCRHHKPNQWCDENDIVLLLREADPANLAVYFADGPNYQDAGSNLETLRELVTKENIERLKLASEASYVDQYSGEETAKWRKLVKQHVTDNPPPVEATAVLVAYYNRGMPPFKIQSYYYPAERLAWKYFHDKRIFFYNSTPLENVDELCVAVAVVDHLEAIEYCRIIADLLLNKSRESVHQKLGHQIEYYYQNMLNADDPGPVWRKIRWSYNENFGQGSCPKPSWFLGDRVPLGGWTELDAFYADLSEFGITASLSRAQKRELKTAGLKASESPPEDPCNYEALQEKYDLSQQEASGSVSHH